MAHIDDLPNEVLEIILSELLYDPEVCRSIPGLPIVLGMDTLINAVPHVSKRWQYLFRYCCQRKSSWSHEAVSATTVIGGFVRRGTEWGFAGGFGRSMKQNINKDTEVTEYEFSGDGLGIQPVVDMKAQHDRNMLGLVD